MTYRKAYEQNSTAEFIYHGYTRDFADRDLSITLHLGDGGSVEATSLRRGWFRDQITVFFDHEGRTVAMVPDQDFVDVEFTVRYPEPLPLCRNCGAEVDPWMFHAWQGGPYFDRDGAVERGYCMYWDRGFMDIDSDTHPTEDARIHGYLQPSGHPGA